MYAVHRVMSIIYFTMTIVNYFEGKDTLATFTLGWVALATADILKAIKEN